MHFREIALIASVTAGLGAADFPQWRGANRDGSITGLNVATWPQKLTRKWKVPVGEGHSSPVIAGNRVFQIARLNDKETVAAYDLASGNKVWEYSYAAPYEMHEAATSHGKGPKSTPVVADGRLFTLGIHGALHCFDASTGKVIWKLESAASPEYGAAFSPLVDAGTLYAHVGTRNKGALTAFDPATGKQKWQWKGDGPAYGSPVIATLGGVRQLITETQENIVGLDAANGQQLWKVRLATDYSQNSITPVIHDGLVIYSGHKTPLVAVRPSKTGQGWTASQVWENKQITLYMNTPVVSSGLLWGLTERNKGQLFGADPKSGKTVWTSRGREAENAALLTQGDLLLALTTNSELIVFRTSPKGFEELRRYTVADAPTWAHPAISGNSVLIKDATSLTRWSID